MSSAKRNSKSVRVRSNLTHIGILADQGFSTSSNGFPGFPAATSGTFERDNYAVYVDAEWTPTDRLVTQAAIRFEDFDDFGSTTNYKVGANWAISDNFGIRSTYSTGFKAPTPGQANASNTSTELINVNGVPTLVNNGTIPATSPVALSVGGKQLEPEESTNFTAGIYATLGNFEITGLLRHRRRRPHQPVIRGCTVSGAD